MAQFNVGDGVTFTTVHAGKNRTRFSSKRGVISAINGAHAHVKYANGRSTMRALDQLTPASEPSALTKMFLSMGSRNEPK